MTIAGALYGHGIIEREDAEILSLGCGIGFGEVGFGELGFDKLTGIDIFDYAGKFPGKFIQHDIRFVREIVEAKSFDIVVCIDIIEHIPREDGHKLIEDAEAIAKKTVIFYTPIEWFENIQAEDSWGYDNPYSLHQSLRKPEDFPGYEIRLPFPHETAEGFLAVKRI